MPEMDGLALAREIRRHRDERELPLVLLTSLGRLPQARSSGEFAVQLAKPVKASQLYNALLKALAEHVQQPEAGEPVPEAGKPATSSLRILLAEDNAVNQKVALRLLDQLGYRADVASNGLEALEALERQPYDVVLMDVQMPELDGLDATRRICERWPADVRPRIIAMTANAMPEDREACFAAGMDDYVAKPIRPNELAEALSRARPLDGQPGTGERGRDAGDQPRRERDREPERARRRGVPGGGDRHVPRAMRPTLLATLRRALERGRPTSSGERRTRSSRTARRFGRRATSRSSAASSSSARSAASWKAPPSSWTESSGSTIALEKRSLRSIRRRRRERFRSSARNDPDRGRQPDEPASTRPRLGAAGAHCRLRGARPRGARPAASPALRPACCSTS